MERITDNMQDFVKIGYESYNRAIQEYSWNKIVNSYLKLINANYYKGYHELI